MKHSQSQDPQDVLCAERLCLALASVLMYQANHERMIGKIAILITF